MSTTRRAGTKPLMVVVELASSAEAIGVELEDELFQASLLLTLLMLVCRSTQRSAIPEGNYLHVSQQSD